MKSAVAFVLVLLLCLGGISVNGLAEETVQTVAVSDATVTTHGRTFYRDGFLWFNWTYSGFSFCFHGTSAQGTFRSEEHNGAQFNVYVDGSLVPANTVILKGTTKNYTLVEGLPLGEHTVTVRRRTENRSNAVAGVSQLILDGPLSQTLPKKSTKTIEVIGDSITCGFGNIMDGDRYSGYRPNGQDGTRTYATLATCRFDAETTVIARSGIGFGYNGGGSTVDTMMDAYEYTDYFRNKELMWDFKSNPSDVVIIALGTNDTSAPGADAYYQAAGKFLAKVRKNNPDAIIIWAYEVITSSYHQQLQQVVIDAITEGDEKVYYHALGMIDKETDGIGLDGHPSLITHKRDAQGLANLIAELTGWEMGPEDPTVTVTAKPESSLAVKDGMLLVPPALAGKSLSAVKEEMLSNPFSIVKENGEKAEDLLTTGLVARIKEGPFVVDTVPICVLGDVDKNGAVNAKDALAVLKHAVGKIQLNDVEKTAATVAGEEKISAKDALQILKYSVGKLDTF